MKKILLFLTLLLLPAIKVNASLDITHQYVHSYFSKDNITATGSNTPSSYSNNRISYFNTVTYQISRTGYSSQRWELKNPIPVTPNSYINFYAFIHTENALQTSDSSAVDSTNNIAVSLRGGAPRANCSSNSTGYSGFYFISCSVPKNMTSISRVEFVLTSQFSVPGNMNAVNLTYGITTDWNTIIEKDNTQEITASLDKNSQDQINAMNKNQEQANKNSQNEVNAMIKQTEATKEQTNTIKDSNVNVDGSFFSGFDNDTHGLTSIITAPLQFIGSITSSTCTPLGLPMPFVEQTAYLPCMSEIYNQWFGSFFNLYQAITFGVVSYWVCVNLFAMVKGFKDPDSDRIEVLDL